MQIFVFRLKKILDFDVDMASARIESMMYKSTIHPKINVTNVKKPLKRFGGKK